MSQIFPKSANAAVRSTLFAVLTLVLFLGWVVFTLMRSSWVTKQSETVTQPIQFSHAHHVGGIGIDCRYCHTSVEKSSFAGIPPTKTCMNCHAQLWTDAPMLEPVRESYRTGKAIEWVRVHKVADFVYFNHSIHVKKGIGCVTCHGRVDQMPLTWRVNTLYMEWCLECHRNPERFVRPREQVFSMTWEPPKDQLALGKKLVADYKIQRLESCSVCHR